MYITIFVSLSLKSLVRPVICRQKRTWKHYNLRIFMAVAGRKTPSPESWKDPLPLDPPFWGHLNINCIFPFYFKAQSNNLSVLGKKRRPWKFLDLDRYAPWLPALFERTILRRKTVFLGLLKSSKNMLRKSILIGLFVLKNNRTIGEPKNLQGG